MSLFVYVNLEQLSQKSHFSPVNQRLKLHPQLLVKVIIKLHYRLRSYITITPVAHKRSRQRATLPHIYNVSYLSLFLYYKRFQMFNLVIINTSWTCKYFNIKKYTFCQTFIKIIIIINLLTFLQHIFYLLLNIIDRPVFTLFLQFPMVT